MNCAAVTDIKTIRSSSCGILRETIRSVCRRRCHNSYLWSRGTINIFDSNSNRITAVRRPNQQIPVARDAGAFGIGGAKNLTDSLLFLGSCGVDLHAVQIMETGLEQMYMDLMGQKMTDQVNLK